MAVCNPLIGKIGNRLNDVQMPIGLEIVWAST